MIFGFIGLDVLNDFLTTPKSLKVDLLFRMTLKPKLFRPFGGVPVNGLSADNIGFVVRAESWRRARGVAKGDDTDLARLGVNFDGPRLSTPGRSASGQNTSSDMAERLRDEASDEMSDSWSRLRSGVNAMCVPFSLCWVDLDSFCSISLSCY